MRNRAYVFLLTLLVSIGYGGRCSGAPVKEIPSAPTLQDAHDFFKSQVSKNGVAALYTASRDGELLGYVRFPLLNYKGEVCNSEISLSNGTSIQFDWTVVGRLEAKDGQMGMWHSNHVVYEDFHMITVEGGIVIKPANSIPKLILAINDEVTRNRLLKAMSLLSSTCRSKTKFD